MRLLLGCNYKLYEIFVFVVYYAPKINFVFVFYYAPTIPFLSPALLFLVGGKDGRESELRPAGRGRVERGLYGKVLNENIPRKRELTKNEPKIQKHPQNEPKFQKTPPKRA